ncbi:hypothetical protein KBB27_01015 [Patescibacteria group bacterium]|nr:hypothetical protein [Patescibacteria group bacterium]
MPATFFLADELTSFLRFPLWWYGAGLEAVARWLWEDLQLEWRRLGVRLWMRSWLQPMYGVRDITGRLFSVFMRTVVIVGRGIWWLLIAGLYFAALLAWLLWMPLAIVLILLPFVW